MEQLLPKGFVEKRISPSDLDKVADLYAEVCQSSHAFIPALEIAKQDLIRFAKDTFGHPICLGRTSFMVIHQSTGDLAAFFIGCDWREYCEVFLLPQQRSSPTSSSSPSSPSSQHKPLTPIQDLALWHSLPTRAEMEFISLFGLPQKGKVMYRLMVGVAKPFRGQLGKAVMRRVLQLERALSYEFHFGVTSHPAMQEVARRLNLPRASNMYLWKHEKDERLRRIDTSEGYSWQFVRVSPDDPMLSKL